jgi:hypothetical protein
MNTAIEAAEVRKIAWSGQLELFPVTAAGVLEEIGLSSAMGTLLFDKKFLGFDPTTRGDLTPAEAAELEFVGTLFASGLPLPYIERMFSGLEPPYSYSIHDCYWDWRASSWRPLPTPPPADEFIEEHLDDLYFDGNAFRLVELRDRIEDMLFKMNESERIDEE